MRNDLGNQAQRRFAGSVVWGKLPTPSYKPSNLANGKSGKPEVVNKLLEDDESWARQAANPGNTAQAEKGIQEDLTAAMAGLTVQPGPKIESTALDWRRAKEKPVFSKPSPSRAGSIFPKGEKRDFIRYTAISRVGTVWMGNADSRLGQNDHPFRAATTILSCTYQRTPDQPRMNDTRPDDYRPFFEQRSSAKRPPNVLLLPYHLLFGVSIAARDPKTVYHDSIA